MQLSTNLQTVPVRIGNTLVPQFYSLYQGETGAPPLTPFSCINIGYGQLPAETTLKNFNLARDPPNWNPNLSLEENLKDTVRGIAFYDGVNCDSSTIRSLYRLNDDYDLQYPSLFLANGPVLPPSRLRSWRPVFMSGQGEYSEALAKLDVGQYFEFGQPQPYGQAPEALQAVQQSETANNIAIDVTNQQEGGGETSSLDQSERQMVIESKPVDEVVPLTPAIGLSI
ncbi:hypothetical protein TWF696_001627 [Orbilia brochopaga]|uniref:Uncharacterized protein n=1 Tax=Orbilia brochopaga TaxID=3140254 RepID=A0AAV9UC71_9PEZI